MFWVIRQVQRARRLGVGALRAHTEGRERRAPRAKTQGTNARALWWMLLVSCVMPGLRAQAGPLEMLQAVAFHPTDPDVFAVVYVEAGAGLLITRDGGQSFALTCTTAIEGAQNISGFTPSVAWTEDGHLLFGSPRGLFRADGHACAFEAIEDFQGRRITDVVVDPDHPSTVYVLTSSGGEVNGVYKSEDNGLTFGPLVTEEGAFFRGLKIVRHQDTRRVFYLSVCTPHADGTGVNCELRISEDEGQTFAAHLLEEAQDMNVLGADSVPPERVYVTAAFKSRTGETLLAYTPGAEGEGWVELTEGQTFARGHSPETGGFLAVDVGAYRLFEVEPHGTMAHALTTRPRTTCFERNPRGDRHYLCAGFEFFAADARGKTEDDALLDLNRVDTLLACPEEFAVERLCKVQLNYGWCGPTHYPDAPICEAYAEPGAAPDAGVADAGGDAEPAERAPAKGCQLGPPRSAPSWLAGCWALLWALRLRSRPRTSSRGTLRDKGCPPA